METRRFRNSAGHGGLFGSLLALISALAGFIESRVELFTKESKRAMAQLLALLICLTGAALFFGIGYLFLIASAVVWLAELTGISWQWIALAVAAAHFLLAFILLLIARNRSTQPLFPASSAELEKDRQWLRDLETISRSRN